MNPKLKSYFLANDLKRPNLLGLVYNILFSIRGRPIIFIYYCVHFDNIVTFLMRRHLKRSFHLEIGKNVKIGTGLILHHPYNIIIDSNVELGNNCQIDQNVTIGGNMKRVKIVNSLERNRPVIGNNVILCAGCLVAGPITVSDNCIVGANATLTFDTEPGSIVANVSKVSVKNILVNNGSYKFVSND